MGESKGDTTRPVEGSISGGYNNNVRICRPWTCSAAAFLVRTFHKGANVRESKKAPEVACGMSMRGSSRKSGPDTSSSKTCAACSPAALRSSCKTWPTSGTMRSGRCCPRRPLAPRTIGGGCSLLPTPTVIALTESIGSYIRSGESWETTGNIHAFLTGWVYGLTGHDARSRLRHIVDPSFIEWMMGVPQGWTAPAGPSLAGSTSSDV